MAQPFVYVAQDSNGNAVSGALANFYIRGTTTRQTAYTDVDLANEAANPLEADLAGRFTAYLDGDLSYSITVTDSSGVILHQFDTIAGSEEASAIAAAASATTASSSATSAATSASTASSAQTAAEAARDAAQAVSTAGAAFTSGGPVAVATTANITLSGEQTIDGVTTSTDRILVKDQSTAAQNGIYVTAAGAWSRATDMNAAGDVEDTAVHVSGGSTQGGKIYVTYSAVTTLGTDNIDWVEAYEATGLQSQIDALVPQGAAAEKSNEYGTTRARNSRFNAEARSTLPKAAIVVLTGQSLNAGRGTTFAKSSTGQNARMLVGGAHLSAMDFWSTNETHTMDWNEAASEAEYVEGGEGQSPGVGIASTLLGGKFERVYLCSVAIGARDIGTLSSGGPRVNVYAAAQRLFELAVAAGYDPYVMFSFRHGEADGSAATGESTYYTRTKSYLEMLQLLGRQLMGKPDAAVPIVMTYPVQSSNGDDDRDIKEALRRLATDIPNVMCRAVYNVPMNGDLVHPTDDGYVLMGEGDGLMLRNFYEGGEATRSITSKLEIIDATWDGATTGIVYFNEEISNDSSLGLATSLAGTDGFEWIDNGSTVTISSVTYQGRSATLTLGSTPAGTTAQQVVRLANQVNTPTGSTPAEIPGADVRRNETAPTSLHDSTFTHDTYASPQTFDNVRDA